MYRSVWLIPNTCRTDYYSTNTNSGVRRTKTRSLSLLAFQIHQCRAPMVGDSLKRAAAMKDVVAIEDSPSLGEPECVKYALRSRVCGFRVCSGIAFSYARFDRVMHDLFANTHSLELVVNSEQI